MKLTLNETIDLSDEEEAGPSSAGVSKGSSAVQELPKDLNYVADHPPELVIGDISKWVTTRSHSKYFIINYAFISQIEPKNIQEDENDYN